MKQQLKSKMSRELILKAGLECFSSNGFRGTSIKDIAQKANISAGRLYHHFSSKLEIFTELLDQYWTILQDPNLRLNQLVAQANFPADFKEIAASIGEVVSDNRELIMLIYVDVIEFQGEHIQRMYQGMAERFQKAYETRLLQLENEKRLNPRADFGFAVMMTFRFFFQFFLVETSFGVENHFGIQPDLAIEKAEEIILHGLLKGEA